MKIKILVFTVIVVLLVIYGYNNFLTIDMVEGEYVNTNYNHEAHLAEVPYVADTLKLLPNKKFVSGYWGEGFYTLSYSLSGTTINLHYTYRFGKGGFETSISRLNFGNPKIEIDKDFDQYYKQVK